MQLSSYRPIYTQLVDLITMEILDKTIAINSNLPEISSFAIQININPNTVEKAYQELVDLGAVTHSDTNWKVNDNAIEILQKHLQEKFLQEEFPSLVHRLHVLGINPLELDWQNKSKK